MKTLTLTHTQHETLRECVATQLKRTESLASLMLAEHRAEPEENKRARIELAKVITQLDSYAHEVPAL
jgi:hypothetical protein